MSTGTCTVYAQAAVSNGQVGAFGQLGGQPGTGWNVVVTEARARISDRVPQLPVRA